MQSSKTRTQSAVGFGLCRPPGHHALPSDSFGFCIFGTAAVAARHAQHHHGLQKILVFDIDVHHGNGTQNIFYSDPSVLVINTHQQGAYPGTGRKEEIGEGDGEGKNINIPLPSGSGHAAALATFEEIVEPAVRAFAPEMMIISAGYDTHFLDPLASLQYSSTTYHNLCSKIRRLAQELCQGRVVFLLEGGYHLKALGESVVDSFMGLLGEESIQTLQVPSSYEEPHDKVRTLLKEITQIQQL
eukprot:g1951.t1